MTIISRYIVTTWLRFLGLCLGGFIAIYLVLDFMEKVGRFLKAGGAVRDIVLFFICKIPEMIGQTAPFSLLMATMLTLGLFSRTSEIIALRACGVGLVRVTLPMLVLGFVVSLLLMINAEFIIPASYEQMEYLEKVAIRKQGLTAFFKRNNIWFRSENMIVQAHLFDPAAQALKGVIVWNLDTSMKPLLRIDADSAAYHSGRWTLKDVTVKDFSRGTGFTTRTLPAMEVALNLKLDDLRVLDNNADNMSFRKLREYAENLRKGGYPAHRYLTLMHAKIASPFSAFVMVVLGIPFSLRNSRSGGVARGIGISVAIGFSYFVINAVLLSYGRSGILPSIVAAWGANFIFVLGGVWLAMKVKSRS